MKVKVCGTTEKGLSGGGLPLSDEVSSYVYSVGFEFETGSLGPCHLLPAQGANGEISPLFYREKVPGVSNDRSDFAFFFDVTADIPVAPSILDLDEYVFERARERAPLRLVRHVTDPGWVLNLSKFVRGAEYWLDHAEEHLLFRLKRPRRNVLLELMKLSVKFLIRYFGGFRRIPVYLAYRSDVPRPKLEFYPRELSLFVGEDKICYLSPMNIESIADAGQWTIQATVGFDLRAAREVLFALGAGSPAARVLQQADVDYYAPLFQGFKNYLESRGIQAQGLIGAFNWLFLLALQFVQQQRSATKFGIYFAMRHRLSEVLDGLSPDEHGLLRTFLLSQSGPGSGSGSGSEFRQFVQRVLSRADVNLPGVTQFKYQSQLILVELRNFNRQLSELTGIPESRMSLSALETALAQIDV
ncbi:MAG: hypothetical protein ACYCOU_19575 [Sulfobacillus sp.]